MATALGIDLGGTKIAFGLMRGDAVVHETEVAVPRGDSTPGILLPLMAAEAEKIKKSQGPFATIGIGAPGQVEKGTGVILKAPNLKNWDQVPLAAELARLTGVPVRVTNDVRSSTLAEWKWGAGKGASSLLNVYLGTGIGGGVVIDNHLLEGEGNMAGEIGHVKISRDPRGPKCGCGARNCMEAYAGGLGLENRYFARARKKNPNLDRAEVSGKLIGQLAKKGDPLALECLRMTGVYVALGVGGLLNVLNPKVLLIGGGVGHLYPFFEEIFLAELKKQTLAPNLARLEIVPCSLGTRAGIMGACAFGAGLG